MQALIQGDLARIKDKFEWISISELTHTTNLVSDFYIVYSAKFSLLPLF